MIVNDIQEAVAQANGITRRDLVYGGRFRRFVYPRQEAMYLARALSRHSLPKIGYLFGGMDHTTVYHAVLEVGKRYESDPDVRDRLEAISQKLRRT